MLPNTFILERRISMIKTLAGCIGKYKKDSIIAPLFVILEVLGEICIPFLVSNLIDYGIDKGNMDYIFKIGSILVLCTILTLICSFIAGRSAAIASCGFARNIRQAMYAKVQNFSFFNIDKFSTASIITRLTTDVSNIQNAYEMVVFSAARAPAMLAFSLIASFRINKELSFIFLACIPFLACGLFFIMTNAHKMFTKTFKSYDNLNEIVGENLNAIRVVKSFAREEFEKSKFYKASNKIYKYFLKGEKIIAFNMPLMQICMYGSTILAAWFGARIIVACRNNPQEGLSTGQLLSLISYATQILTSLMILSMVLTMITISISSAKRISEILNEESDIKSPANPEKTVKNGDITFENVNLSYVKDETNLCLKNINLSIKSGEVIGITGETGTGKSTLVHLIPRLYDTTSGNVLVGDKNVKSYDLKVLRDSVSMVLQKNTLFSGTVAENLRWGNENATNEEMKKVCKIACADEFIENMPQKYETYIERGGTNVSGGQKQRLCIARALLKKPKILILDDSTSALDTKTEATIIKAFKEEIPHITKIIISQRISSVKAADKIIVMKNGEIAGFDSHEKLLETCGSYKEIWDLQSKKEGA